MLTLSSCPQCRHVFPVSTNTSGNIDTNTTTSLPFNRPEARDNKPKFDHNCISSNHEIQYDSNNDDTVDSNSDFNDEYFDWNEEDYGDSMEDVEEENDTLVTFREHVSTKRPISNRLSLCGGGLITINQEVEPIEPLTPLEDCYNPLKFIGNPAFRYPEERTVAQSSNNLKRIHHKPETLSKQKLEDGRRDSIRRESKVHVTAAESSQISPSMPLTFVLPVPRSHTNPIRPVSHILMTQKSEILPSTTTITDFHVVYPAQHVRPLSLQINCNNGSVQPCIPYNLYLLPWQQDTFTPQDSQTELNRLEILAKRLNMSCWYYDSMTWQKSEDLLKNSAPGTFLVRNSSDPNYLYSLSVQTKNGPTSIRLSYVNGAFCLDSQQNLQQSMPKFTCIIKLIEYYIHFTLLQEKRNSHKIDSVKRKIDNKVWMDSNGSVHSEIVLKRPLYKEVPSLKHLSRLKIHEAINSNGQPKLPLLPGYKLLELPKILVEYLAEYPYAH